MNNLSRSFRSAIKGHYGVQIVEELHYLFYDDLRMDIRKDFYLIRGSMFLFKQLALQSAFCVTSPLSSSPSASFL